MNQNPLEETMKKTLSLLAVLMAAGVASSPAQAADHYVSAFGGISWMNDMTAEDASQYPSYNPSADISFGSGLAVLGAVGCDYGSYRVEAEVGYQKSDIKTQTDNYGSGSYDPYDLDGDASVLSLMANGYYDFDLGSKVELYATAGIGVAQVSFDSVTPANGYQGEDYTAHETTLAWQVGAGIAAPIADNVKLDLRYRYFATTDFTNDNNSTWWGNVDSLFYGGSNSNISSHSVLLGLRVGF